MGIVPPHMEHDINSNAISARIWRAILLQLLYDNTTLRERPSQELPVYDDGKVAAVYHI